MPAVDLYPAKLLLYEIQYHSHGKIEKKNNLLISWKSCFRTKKEPGQCLTEEKINENKELAKLKLFGAGPKMAGLGIYPTERELYLWHENLRSQNISKQKNFLSALKRHFAVAFSAVPQSKFSTLGAHKRPLHA